MTARRRIVYERPVAVRFGSSSEPSCECERRSAATVERNVRFGSKADMSASDACICLQLVGTALPARKFVQTPKIKNRLRRRAVPGGGGRPGWHLLSQITACAECGHGQNHLAARGAKLLRVIAAATTSVHTGAAPCGLGGFVSTRVHGCLFDPYLTGFRFSRAKPLK